MDSVSQFVLGASIAGVCAPARHRRKALLLGGALGTLPDLDVIIDYGDPVSNFTYHRGFSHSLFVLLPFSLLLWLLLRSLWAPVREAPGRWMAAVVLTLVTHPLLDAHTVYGTQLLWPLETPPVMWSTLFIIDPLYTLPLLAGFMVAILSPRSRLGGVTLAAGLVLSSAYLGWSWVAKSLVERHTVATLQAMSLQDAPRFSVPTPFNTLLWRVVVMTGDGYLEAYRSLPADRGPMRFTAYPSNTHQLREAGNVWAVQRLRWFSHDFLKAELEDDLLVLSDLRMGLEPDYVFNFAVARRGNPHWEPVPPQQLPSRLRWEALPDLWQRILGH